MKKKLLLLATCLFSVLMANAESWKTLYFEDFGDVTDWPVDKHYLDQFMFYDGDPSGFTPWGSNWGVSVGGFPLGRSKNETGGTYAHIKSPGDYYYRPDDGSRAVCDSYGTYMPNYVIGGDHTYPYDYGKGCFVYAQMPLPSIPQRDEYECSYGVGTWKTHNYALGPLFHKTIDISNMHNTTFRASAWIANFSTTKDVDVWMYIAAFTKDGECFCDYGEPSNGDQSEFKLKNAQLFRNIRKYDWVNNTCTYKFGGDYKWDKLVFIIEYRTKKNCYWGLGIDDIKIEFDQSTAGVAFALSKTVRGRNVTIKPDITLKRLEDILGTNHGYFYYSWSHLENGVYKTIGGGRLGSTSDLEMRFSYFVPNKHNGRWKLKIWNNVTSVERFIDLNLKDSDLAETRGIGLDDDEEEVNYDEVQKPNIYNDGTNLYVNGTSENSQIIVYDMSGNAVAYSTTSPVNISVLKKGVYVVDINGTKVKFMKK